MNNLSKSRISGRLLMSAIASVMAIASLSYFLSISHGLTALTCFSIAFVGGYLLRPDTETSSELEPATGSLESFTDEAPDLMLLRDNDGKMLSWNKTLADTLGYDHDTLSEINFFQIDSDCYLRRHPQMTLDINLGQTKVYETVFTTKNGDKIPVEIATRLAQWGNNPIYIDIARDITQRRLEQQKTTQSRAELERVRNKLESRMQIRSLELERQIRNRQRAEQDVNEIRLFLSHLIDAMPSAIIAIDSDQIITQWNKRTEEITGLHSQDCIGRHLYQALPDFEQELSSSRAAIESGQALHTQRLHTSMQNNQYIFDIVVYPVKATTLAGLVIRIDDVTEKSKLEETLVQTEKMLSLGGLAAGMAHEINNPLGAILQSCQNITRRLSLERDRNHEIAREHGTQLESVVAYLEAQRITRFVKGIETSGQRAANIVNDMLSFARPVRGDLVLINLAESIEQAVRLAESDYNQKKKLDFKKVRIIKEFPERTVQVMAQKNQLEQVFLNLLINAAQAMASSLLEAPPQIIIRLSTNHEVATLEFIDNGPGMTDAVRRRVFEPFFTTKEEGSGTGLGLSVSYFIITEQMQGMMEVDTSPGRGTRFIIKLPLSRENLNKTLPKNSRPS